MPDRTFVYRHTDESSSSDEDLTAKQTPVPVHTDPAPAGGGVSYQKTLRLSSEQLVSILNLRNLNLFFLFIYFKKIDLLTLGLSSLFLFIYFFVFYL